MFHFLEAPSCVAGKWFPFEKGEINYAIQSQFCD